MMPHHISFNRCISNALLLHFFEKFLLSMVVLISAARAGFLTTPSTSVLILTIIHSFVKSSRVDNFTSQDVASCRNEYHHSQTVLNCDWSFFYAFAVASVTFMFDAVRRCKHSCSFNGLYNSPIYITQAAENWFYYAFDFTSRSSVLYVWLTN